MKSQKQGALLGALVADALSLPVHWIYDPAQIKNRFARITDFHSPDQQSYHAGKQAGDFTHYGDQTRLLLRHIYDANGQFSLPVFAQLWQNFFIDYRGYIVRASKTTLQNLQDGKALEICGSSSSDLGGCVRIAAIVGLLQGDSQSVEKAVLEQTSLTHNSTSVKEGALFLARSCFAMFNGATPREAFSKVIERGIQDIDLDMRLRNAMEIENLTVEEAVKQFGAACAITQALPGAVYAVLAHENDIENCLIDTVMAGGDSAARGMAAGMLLGAYLGVEKIPARWRKNLACADEIEEILSSPLFQ